MDRQHVKGAADKARGAIEKGARKLSGDKDLEAKGKIDKVKGFLHTAAGDVKDAADALKKAVAMTTNWPPSGGQFFSIERFNKLSRLPSLG